MTETFQQVTDQNLAALSRVRWYWIRTIAYWTATCVVVSELVAGSVWNLEQIEWIRVQLNHLGYPTYFSWISGLWQVAGAVAIAAPGFSRLKEWAYAGAFFTWSGAVASHLITGDGPESWVTPLVFATFAIVSWALRPVDRRLPDAGRRPENSLRAWAVPVGILIVLFVVSHLTLPWINAVLHQRLINLGWIPR